MANDDQVNSADATGENEAMSANAVGENEATGADSVADNESIGESISDETVVSPVELPQMGVSVSGGDDQKNRDRNLSMILDIPVDIHVELGQARMNIRNILNFTEGTVIELERASGDPVDIVVNGKFIGKGEVIVVDENFGIRVTELVDPEKRIESF